MIKRGVATEAHPYKYATGISDWIVTGDVIAHLIFDNWRNDFPARAKPAARST